MTETQRSHYITAEGENRLRSELRQLWRVERPEWTQRVSDAAKEGDRSENAEYIYSKKKLRELDRRIRYLSKRLDNIQVVRKLPADQSRVYFGAWVTLQTSSGRRKHRLVGSDEFDHHPDYISVDSPLARAMLGKSIGDTIALSLEQGLCEYQLISINYQSDD